MVYAYYRLYFVVLLVKRLSENSIDSLLQPKVCTCLHRAMYFRNIVTKVSEFLSYRSADKSLVRPGRKQVTATEDF